MILITRPIKEAKILAKEIKQFNVKTFNEPLTSFKYFKKEITFNNKKLFIITSSQAVQALRKYQSNYRQIISEGEFVVVGVKVVNELNSLGIKKIIKNFSTSNSLVKYLTLKKFKERKIVYLCGTVISQDFINGLKNNRINYQKKIIYEVIAKKQISKKCFDLMKNKKIKIVLIYSEYSGKLFSKFINENDLNKFVNGIGIICLSKRISKVVKKLIPHANILYSRSPNQNALLAKLQSQLIIDNKS